MKWGWHEIRGNARNFTHKFKQKSVFFFQGQREGKRFSIVTGHSHARAQPEKWQTKQNSLSLCVCVGQTEINPAPWFLIFLFHRFSFVFVLPPTTEQKIKIKKPSSEHNNHTGNYISTCTFIITYTHQEPSRVPGGGGIYNIFTRNDLFNLIFFFTCFFFEEERISRHTHTRTNRSDSSRIVCSIDNNNNNNRVGGARELERKCITVSNRIVFLFFIL